MTVENRRFSVWLKGRINPTLVDAEPGGYFDVSHSGALVFHDYRGQIIRAFNAWIEVARDNG